MPILIRGGHVMTLDVQGDIEGGDVLVEGDRIAAIGRELAAPAGCEVIDAAGTIVMPGLINAHIHTWQLGLRGIGSDWVSSRDYARSIHSGMAKHYLAEDNYVANLIGALVQINGGVTTLFAGATTCATLRDRLVGRRAGGVRHPPGFGRHAKPPPAPG